ncbi:MAG: RNA methyltransferase [Polyangiaceae bacterium]|nr:RNA methyltransferase [Polyangiaceae bacterium]
MRRRTQDVFIPARVGGLEDRLGDDRVEAAIDALAPLVTPARRARLDGVIAARLASVCVLMDAPYDPHNGSAVVRTMDAFGVQDLHVVERQAPFTLHASVARGSHKWLDLFTYQTPEAALRRLCADGFHIAATHPDGALVPEQLAGIPRLCVLLGNEHDGIDPRLQAGAHTTVRVPMRGFAESLNVSVTAALLLHAAGVGRAGDLPPARRRRLYLRGLLYSLERAEDILTARGVLA